jgi:integrase
MTPETLLIDVLDDYFRSNIRIRCPRTRDHYKLSIRKFGESLGHSATLGDLTDDNAIAFIHWSLSDGYNEHTANQRVKQIRALWNWLAKRRLVEQFPTIEKMPEPRALPTAWTVDELRKLLKGCERMPGTIADIPSPLWWQALHYVFWNTGERTGALLALTWQMLDAKTGQLAVPAEFRKGGKKPMLYRLKPQTMQLLDAIRQPERELIFPFPLNKGSFYGRYKLLLKLAGLPYAKYKSALQKMRRSFATHLEAAGGNATDALEATGGAA